MSKRIQKKRFKKEIISELKQYGYQVSSKTEKMTVAELEQTVKKKRKQYKQNLTRKQNVSTWEQLGIDKSIISRYDLRNKNPGKVSDSVLKEIKNESRKVKYNRTRLQNMERRREKLISSGVDPNSITYNMIRSDDIMYSVLGKTNPNKVFHSNVFLAICFTDVNGSTIFNTSRYKEFSFEELKQHIQERIKDGQEEPDNSGVLALVFDITDGTQEECEQHLNDMSQRGYNLSKGKLTDRRYHRLVNRNDWTMREFAEMTCCLLDQIHNRDIPYLISSMQQFLIDSGLPFNEVFN